MSRRLRVHFSGGVYHVTARGNDRQPIFKDDDDCSRFLVVLASVVSRYRVLCHAYCLMGNHYHLLLETPEGNLSPAMRQLNGVYTQRFNRRHERCGHLLQGRFGAQLVGGDSYLREVCRYIVLNPVRAGLVPHPREWRWSSFRATAGEMVAPGFLTVSWVRSLAGAATGAEALRRYTAFVEAGIGTTDDAIETVSSRPVIGDDAFVGRVGERCRDAGRSAQIPRSQRFAGRPGLGELFIGVSSRAERDRRAVAAVRDHGYAMRRVAEFLGLHYVTVSRALARADADHAGRNVGM